MKKAMKKLTVTVDGKEYPCRQTMGAMLRFKKETGKEVTELGQGDFTDFCTYLWCCVVSACKHDGVEFGQSLMDFADSISPDDLTAWNAALEDEEAPDGEEADGGGDGEKKSR